MANKDKQIEKRNREMARRKAEAEARTQALKAKKRKRAIIAIVAACLVVAVVCAVTVGVTIAKSNKYTELDFKTLKVPTTAAEAQSMQKYGHQNVIMEGYTFACTSKYYVLCKSAVSSCPYVTGTIPDNSIRMEMKDGSYFTLGNNARVRIWGRLEINTTGTEKFEGQETYMYLVLDKIEEI
ncbi:MAG: hypothetical protein II896_06190 [Clostridia bacterium]|nr:hypothetical protein [Clostridia bacterium]